MPVITVFSSTFSDGEQLCQRLSDELDYELITDDIAIAAVAKAQELPDSKVRRVLYGKPSIFNRFTHERERITALVKAATAELLSRDGLVFHGRTGHLIPPTISHVLKVCIIADLDYRIARAREQRSRPEAQIVRELRADDERQREWSEFILHRESYNPTAYDIVIPISGTTMDAAVELIIQNVRKNVVQPTEVSIQAVRDFALAAKVEIALSDEGHDVEISACGSKVTITINKHVIMLSRLEEELKRIVLSVDGVEAAETRVGPDFYQSDIYRKHDFEVPSKVLLVDDEREFVQVLSGRLQNRDVGSAIAYNGEEALSVIDEDEPEVMVLDLKMPGIDGVEVLRRVRRDHPDVAVIILTGHGNEEDERVCRDLGAFAYIRKPVDIDELSEVMKAAYKQVRESRGRGQEPASEDEQSPPTCE